MGTEFQFKKMKMESDIVMVVQYCECSTATKLYT